ncbi:MAG: hypothetical protein EOP56_10465 [Sphingobacteriales bacterium]|nr:MAG: hypothetical protein EOP56_10465 [Sphingobacteriales bacterium]
MKYLSAAVAALLMMLIGCGTASEITNTWVKPQAGTAGISRIMVLALVGENRELRQQMENSLASNLQAAGFSAFSSLAEYGPQMFDASNEESAVEQMKNKNVDAVLTVVLLDEKSEQHYVPGTVQYTPYAIQYNRFWGYYSTVYNRTYIPGYYSTSTNYFWESNLYNVQSEELLYSAQTRSFNPNSPKSLAKDYGKLIANDLRRNRITPQSTASPTNTR